jgi:arginine/lysine/ornithine decarboxylase
MKRLPVAVYLTAPDYLGNDVDWDAISAVCHRHGVLLAADCAHGAYLRFLKPSRYPIDHGADLCCSSAHKTLPVLTGGAYLHVSPSAPACFSDRAKDALAVFGSTSPSYLILQSLDGANAVLSGTYPEELAMFAEQVTHLRARAEALGYRFVGGEPMKLTIKSKEYGYLGTDYAPLLREHGIECEFADPDFVVLMLTPDTGRAGIARLWNAMQAIPRRSAITETPPQIKPCERVLSLRDAMLAPSELLEIGQCEGRILASASVGCPPAVPIAVCGERLDRDAIHAFAYYGIERIRVVK